jgi:hypothetical protein
LDSDRQTVTRITEAPTSHRGCCSQLQRVGPDWCAAPSLKELQRKLDTVQRALRYMQEEQLSPVPKELTTGDE